MYSSLPLGGPSDSSFAFVRMLYSVAYQYMFPFLKSKAAVPPYLLSPTKQVVLLNLFQYRVSSFFFLVQYNPFPVINPQ